MVGIFLSPIQADEYTASEIIQLSNFNLSVLDSNPLVDVVASGIVIVLPPAAEILKAPEDDT